MNSSSTTWQDRAHAVGFYLGLWPIYALLPEKRAGEFTGHHYRQAGALFALFTALTLVFAAVALSLSYLLINYRAVYQDYHLESYLVGGLRKLYLAWLVFWAFALGLALLGSVRPMPLVERLTHRKPVLRFALASLILAYLAVALSIPVALHGRVLAPPEHTHGPVHFLYDDNGLFPRWLFVIAFYPMTRRATALWGEGAVVIQRFEREAVHHAVTEGEFLYLGTHGTVKGLMIEGGWLVPEDLEDIDINPNLKFVYLSGCDSGQQRDGWLAAFAPAEVVTYDRLSAVLEHVWWLWFRGPAKLTSVHKESVP